MVLCVSVLVLMLQRFKTVAKHYFWLLTTYNKLLIKTLLWLYLMMSCVFTWEKETFKVTCYWCLNIKGTAGVRHCSMYMKYYSLYVLSKANGAESKSRLKRLVPFYGVRYPKPKMFWHGFFNLQQSTNLNYPCCTYWINKQLSGTACTAERCLVI